MKTKRQYLVILVLFILPFLFSAGTEQPGAVETPTCTTVTGAGLLDTGLPEGYNHLFAGSGVCLKCHGFDTLGLASVDMNGSDVNVVSDWRSTMMANAAKDPFWRAKVSHEVLLYPQHQAAIENKCTACHAPLGHFNALHTGAGPYSIDQMAADPLALDGVSCLACHQQLDVEEPQFSGHLQYDTFKVAYGPFPLPLVSPMLTETGFKPVFSPHISDADVCAGCHTLITETLDYDGNPTGDQFVEQATYHEWLNSVYADSVSCQGCHMPNLDKWPVYLVTGSQTEPRNPFSMHELVGGNVTMLKLLQNHIDPLGLTANEAQFEETIQKTLDMLQQRTISTELKLAGRNENSALFELHLTNLSGHKFPSGYPSRRAFVEFFVATESGDTLFHSGAFDQNNYELLAQNTDYEPHYDTLVSEEEVQIYELVMGDVNEQVTTVLLRAKSPLKDNRLPPVGFTTAHPSYDTTLIAGAAMADPNFNKLNGSEGSGTDKVYYRVPLNGFGGALLATAKVWYQPVPPKWNQEMFAHNSPEIDLFRDLLNDADRQPVLVAQDTAFAVQVVATAEAGTPVQRTKAAPIPTPSGEVTIFVPLSCEATLYTADGHQVGAYSFTPGNHRLQLPVSGAYWLLVSFSDGAKEVLALVRR